MIEEIKRSIENNAKELIRRGIVKVDNVTQLLLVINASVDEGYSKFVPQLLSLVADDNVESVTSAASVFDVITEMTLRNRTTNTLAAFTIVRNEPVFLDMWCSYYSKHVSEENLYVLDNNTTDDSIKNTTKRWPKIHVVNIQNRDAFDYTWMTNTVKTFQRALLRAYEAVIFSDSDEFLMPILGDLRQYCDDFLKSERQYVRAEGWGVVHQIDSEPEIDLNRPLSNRNSMFRAPMYDKTLISKVPLEWARGFHTIYRDGKKLNEDPVDETLCVLHVRDIDLNTFHQRCINRSKMQAVPGGSFHGAEASIEQIKAYFRTLETSWTATPTREYLDEKRRVPESWKNQLTK